MTEQNITPRVDQTALKVNQAFIISLLVLAFVFDQVALVAFVGLVMLVGTASPRLALFQAIYRHLLRPAGWPRPRVIPDNPEPHRFAQGLGGVFVALATLALLAGWSVVGWTLAGLVVFLAGLNLFLGFCAGCYIYYQLSRRGWRGFVRQPLEPEGGV